MSQAVLFSSICSAGIIITFLFYNWYNKDKDYNDDGLLQQRYNEISNDYKISKEKLLLIHGEFINEMNIGLQEKDNLSLNKKKSSLKMLSSNIRNIPNGDEKGIFYALDLGGSNYRILRVEFLGKKGSNPIINEYRHTLKSEYIKCDNDEKFFDHLSIHIKNEFSKYNELNTKKIFSIGFTFSFPMIKPAINSGILLEWTKEFDIPNVVGNDIVDLMQKAFDRNEINAKIDVICNDTVGTLLSCAYNNDNVRVGLIIGTGTNAAYIEPNKENEIINTELCSFNNKILPRKSIDIEMDKLTIDGGKLYAMKMTSGYYLGELVRLLSIEIFKEKITNYGKNTPLNIAWKFKSEIISDILNEYYKYNIIGVLNILHGDKCRLYEFNKFEAEIFSKICVLIINRSADIIATLLLGTLQKTGLFFINEKNNKFQLTNQYKKNDKKIAVVGIDGSVYKYVPKYKQRMKQCIIKLAGNEISSRIKLINSSDGSGKGAALAVAAAAHCN